MLSDDLKVEVLRLAVADHAAILAAKSSVMLPVGGGKENAQKIYRDFLELLSTTPLGMSPRPAVQEPTASADYAAYSPSSEAMRGTGRTTAAMLRCLAAAIDARGEWVPFVDHDVMTSTLAMDHARQLAAMSIALGVKVAVESLDSIVRVRSTYAEFMKSIRAGRIG